MKKGKEEIKVAQLFVIVGTKILATKKGNHYVFPTFKIDENKDMYE